MRRRITSLVIILAVIASSALTGCPARRGGSPADLDPTFLDRA